MTSIRTLIDTHAGWTDETLQLLLSIIHGNPGWTAAQIAAAFNTHVSRFRPVASNAVLEWIGGNGRKLKLDRFVAAYRDTTDPLLMQAVGAVDTVLLAATNSTSYLTLDPTSGQRQLLDAIVGIAVIDQADADALIAKAKPTADITEAEVVEVLTAIAREVAVKTWGKDNEEASAAAAAAIDLDPINTDIDAVILAYSTALRAARLARTEPAQ